MCTLGRTHTHADYEAEEEGRAQAIKENRKEYQAELQLQAAENDLRKKQQRQAELEEAQRMKARPASVPLWSHVWQEEEEFNQARMQAQLMNFTMTQTRKSARQ
jgi:hypothetical protein